MLQYLRNWYDRAFADPRAVTLTVILLSAGGLIWLMIATLKPVLVSIILAYLLEDVVNRLEKRRVKRSIAVVSVWLGFVAFLVITLVEFVPILSGQFADLLRELPAMLAVFQDRLMQLTQLYPALFRPEHIEKMVAQAGSEMGKVGQQVISSSFRALPALIAILLYLILVPLLVYFFLQDKDKIVGWFKQYLPTERSLAKSVWIEIDDQIGNYIRGKVMEIVIIGVAAFALLATFGLNYAALLGVAIGFSVLIPFVGATLVTLPVALVAYFQFGITATFGWIMIAYLILQVLDGNVLVPLLFSEVVNLHPAAIIVAVLFFGSIWGVWGVFFAIPLATTARAIVRAWPTKA